MSAFQKKIEITENERKAIECMTVLRENMDTKLLLCMLETLQEMKQEIAALRKNNEQMRQTIESIVSEQISYGITKKAVTVHTLNT
jgi:hypothetical protein